MTTYTAEDYREEAERFAQSIRARIKDGTAPPDAFPNPIILSALAIAARVMEPGVMEDALHRHRLKSRKAMFNAIRRALTETKP